MTLRRFLTVVLVIAGIFFIPVGRYSQGFLHTFCDNCLSGWECHYTNVFKAFLITILKPRYHNTNNYRKIIFRSFVNNIPGYFETGTLCSCILRGDGLWAQELIVYNYYLNVTSLILVSKPPQHKILPRIHQCPSQDSQYYYL